jgi:hypothetical protein
MDRVRRHASGVPADSKNPSATEDLQSKTPQSNFSCQFFLDDTEKLTYLQSVGGLEQIKELVAGHLEMQRRTGRGFPRKSGRVTYQHFGKCDALIDEKLANQKL